VPVCGKLIPLIHKGDIMFEIPIDQEVWNDNALKKLDDLAVQIALAILSNPKSVNDIGYACAGQSDTKSLEDAITFCAYTQAKSLILGGAEFKEKLANEKEMPKDL